MHWFTENVALQILALLSLFGTPVVLFIRYLIKRGEIRAAFDLNNIFTKADWRLERDELRKEHQRSIAELREEHAKDMEERVGSIVRFYEEKIKGIVAAHKAEVQSLISSHEYTKRELEAWKKHANERKEETKHEIIDEIRHGI